MANDSLYEAWVKAHHTSDFYEVTLNHYQDKEDKNKVAALIREAITVFGYSMGKYQYGKDNSKFNVDDSEKVIYPNLASVKGIGKQVLVDLMDIYKSGVNDFIDIYCSIKGTKINATVFKNLVKIGYFKKYGSIKQLLSIIDIYDIWKGSSGDGRKTISKSEVHKLGLDEINLYKYATDRTPSGKISDKQFTNVDWIGLVRELSSRVSNEEYGIGMLVKYQYEVLGYIDYINPQLDKRYVVITELDNTYSPKFKAYCLATGQSAEMKIHKNLNYKEKEIKVSVQECPIEDGDIIYMRSCKQKQRQRKENDEWVNVPDTFDWWINDYYKVVF
jgi:hypothetical protein